MKIQVIKRILTNPFTIFLSIGIGIYIGLNFPQVARTISPFGKMYLYLLQMSVLPILVSAIISSLAKLIKSKGIKDLMLRMIVVFVLAVFISSILGVLTGVISQPGRLISEDTRTILGSYVESSVTETDLSVSLSEPYNVIPRKGIVDFVTSIIPSNIFDALASGRALELVFFSIILGIAIGTIKDSAGIDITNIFVALFLAFQQIINWAMLVLPLGLICLIADQIASSGLEVIKAMGSMIVIFYIIGIIVMICNTFIISFRSKHSFWKVTSATLTPIMIAFSTRSSFAAIPACVKALDKQLYFDRAMTNLLIPLGITLGRYGNIIYFGLVSVFLAQLYNIEFGTTEIILTILGSILAGVATAGATGFATLAAIQVVLNPLGLPYEVVIVILLAIDTIVDPMRTTLIVQTNLVFASIVAKPFKGTRKPQEEDITDVRSHLTLTPTPTPEKSV